MATDNVYTLVQNSKFIGNLAVCTNEIMEGTKFIGKLKPIIEQLPELVKKAPPFGKEGGGLVLLSAYVFYKSFELYNRALDLEEDYKMYRDEFEALKGEMKPFKDFIVTQLIPEWEKGNAGNLRKVTDELLGKMNRQLTVFQELIRSIHINTKKAGSDIRWSVFYSVIVVATCGFSIPSGNCYVICVTCGAAIGTVFYTVITYRYNINNLTKLDMLREDANTMHKEITKYRAQLDVAKMRGELYI